jgi:curved DNA-binding protein CbpA
VTDNVVHSPNYYEILQVDYDADVDEIRRAYRRRAKEIHPDLRDGEGGEDTRRLSDLVRAYRVLSDERLREDYDRRVAVRFRRSDFNYRAFLVERSDDRSSQARLIEYDLLHQNGGEAVRAFDRLRADPDFDLEQLLGRDDYMECAYMLSEEYEAQERYQEAFDLLTRVVENEYDRPHFRHFFVEVVNRLRTIACFRMPDAHQPDAALTCLHRLIAYNFSRKETAFFFKKAAELYLEMDRVTEATEYLRRGLALDAKLAGAKKLRERIRA